MEKTFILENSIKIVFNRQHSIEFLNEELRASNLNTGEREREKLRFDFPHQLIVSLEP